MEQLQAQVGPLGIGMGRRRVAGRMTRSSSSKVQQASNEDADSSTSDTAAATQSDVPGLDLSTSELLADFEPLQHPSLLAELAPFDMEAYNAASQEYFDLLNSVSVSSPVVSDFTSTRSLASSNATRSTKRKASNDASTLSTSLRKKSTAAHALPYSAFPNLSQSCARHPIGHSPFLTSRKDSLFMSVPASSTSTFQQQQQQVQLQDGSYTFNVSMLSPPSSSTYSFPANPDASDIFTGGGNPTFPLSAPPGLDYSYNDNTILSSTWNGFLESFSTPPRQAVPVLPGSRLTADDVARLEQRDEGKDELGRSTASQVHSDLSASTSASVIEHESTNNADDTRLSLFASQVRRKLAGGLSLDDGAADAEDETHNTPIKGSNTSMFNNLPPLPQGALVTSDTSASAQASTASFSIQEQMGTLSSSKADGSSSGVSAGAADTTPLRSSRGHHNKKSEGRVSRPPNAWILYRSDMIKELLKNPKWRGEKQCNLSKVVGQLWNQEDDETRQRYNRRADQKKAEHMRLHPDYKYTPRRAPVHDFRLEELGIKPMSASSTRESSTVDPELSSGSKPPSLKRSRSGSPVKASSDDIPVPTTPTPIGEFVPSFDAASFSLALPPLTTTSPLPELPSSPSPSSRKQARLDPPASSLGKSAYANSRMSKSRIPVRSASPTVVIRGVQSFAGREVLHRQTANSFARQRGLAQRAETPAMVNKNERAATPPNRSVPTFGLVPPSNRMQSKSPLSRPASSVGSTRNGATAARYQQPTAASMARSVTYPSTNSVYSQPSLYGNDVQQQSLGPHSRLAQTLPHSHIHQPVPRYAPPAAFVLDGHTSIRDLISAFPEGASGSVLIQEARPPVFDANPAQMDVYQSHQHTYGSDSSDTLWQATDQVYQDFQDGHSLAFYSADSGHYETAYAEMPLNDSRQTLAVPQSVPLQHSMSSPAPSSNRHGARHNPRMSTTSIQASQDAAQPMICLRGKTYTLQEAQELVQILGDVNTGALNAMQPEASSSILPKPEYLLHPGQSDSGVTVSAQHTDHVYDLVSEYLVELPPQSALPTPETGSSAYTAFADGIPSSSSLAHDQAYERNYNLLSSSAEYGGSLPASAYYEGHQSTIFLEEDLHAGGSTSFSSSVFNLSTGSSGSSNGNFSLTDPNDTVIVHPDVTAGYNVAD